MELIKYFINYAIYSVVFLREQVKITPSLELAIHVPKYVALMGDVHSEARLKTEISPRFNSPVNENYQTKCPPKKAVTLRWALFSFSSTL